jgi:hypothetical protein
MLNRNGERKYLGFAADRGQSHLLTANVPVVFDVDILTPFFL